MGFFDEHELQLAASRLGETILDSRQWPDVMEDICKAVGASGAVLLQSETRTADVPRTKSIEDLAKPYFSEGWHLDDPRAARSIPLVLRGRTVLGDEDIFTPEEISRSPFHNELTFRHGFNWFGVVGFWAGSSLWGLCFQLTAGEGPFDGATKQSLSRLSGRLSEVASVSRILGRSILAGSVQTLNDMRQAALGIGRNGFVLMANDCAEKLFDDDIYIRDRRVLVRDRQASQLLDRVLDRLRVTSDLAEVPAGPIVIRREQKAPVIVRMQPIHGGARSPFLGARALLTLVPLEPAAGPSPALLTRAFGLTPAEARLAATIAQGKAPEQAAEELGIARTTVRNQLRAIFSKTNTHRQSELVALLARL
jgi:DNA-binding CsgD family transcriptional regulator